MTTPLDAYDRKHLDAWLADYIVFDERGDVLADMVEWLEALEPDDQQYYVAQGWLWCYDKWLNL